MVTFAPTVLGALTGVLSIFDDAGTGTQTVALKGTAVTPVSLSPLNLALGSVVIGLTSAVKSSILTNNQTVPLNISGMVISGPFGLNSATTCGTQVPAKGKCSLAVSYSPIAVGKQTGSLTIYDDALNNPSQAVGLSATGVAEKLVSITVTPNPASAPLGTKQQFIATGAYNNLTNKDLTNSVNWSSSQVAVASISNLASSRGLATTVSKGTTTILAQSGTIVGRSAFTVSAPALISIAVTPANPTVAAGLSQQFTASGTYTDGTTSDITAAVTWSSSDTTVATLTSGGKATGGTSGTTTIAANVGSIGGSTILTVGPAVLVSLAVSPANVSIPLGTHQQFTATGTYSDSSTLDLSGSVTWDSSSPSVATISNSPGMQGDATAVSRGLTFITANSGSVHSNAATLTVQQAALSSITISPANPTVNTGDTQQFTATGNYSDGTSGSIGVTWTSATTSVAVIDSNGLAIGDASGSSVITATALSSSVSGTTTLTVNSPDCATNNRLDMKLLVITNGRSEADLPAITGTLDYLHTPYAVFDVTTGPVTQAMLYSACHAFYNGVIVAFLDGSASPPFAGSDSLATFESTFGIRQVNWYVYPSPALGFNWPTGSQEGDSGTFSAASASIFPYVNQSNPLAIDPNAYVFLATGLDGTPLLTDPSGNALALLEQFTDGRQYLSLTFDSNAYMTHNLVLSYGLVNWVTKGLFVGEKHIYFTAQEDDWGIDDHQWLATTPCGTPSDDDSLPQLRIHAADADAFVAWQTSRRADPIFAGFKLYNAFNGYGFTSDAYPNDDLTPWTANPTNSGQFGWINHTFNHTNMDGNSYATDASEITQNIGMAATMGFADFSPASMVTPDISGLNDATFLQAAFDNGVRYLVSDTSQPNTNNNGPGPGFNLPIVNSIQPSITEIPRRANNLFFNAGDPAGWVQEYRCIYAGQAPYDTFDYQQILDNIAQSFVALMLRGDADPEMFHQTNLAAYDGVHSLLGDLLDNTFSQYESFFNLPVRTLDQAQLGTFMLNNQAVHDSAVVSTINNGISRTITISVQHPATIPVTGLSTQGAETYGGQSISHLNLGAGETVTVPAP